MQIVSMNNNFQELDEWEKSFNLSKVVNENLIVAANNFFNAKEVDVKMVLDLFSSITKAMGVNPDLEIKKIKGKITGCYLPTEKKLEINNKNIKNDIYSRYLISDTLFHECRHAYQHKVEMGNERFNKNVRYANCNYTSTLKKEYYANFTELDAREFATTIVSELINYLEKNTPKQKRKNKKLKKINEELKKEQHKCYDKCVKALERKNKRFYKKCLKRFNVSKIEKLSLKEQKKLHDKIMKLPQRKVADILINLNKQISAKEICERSNNKAIIALIKRAEGEYIPPKFEELKALLDVHYILDETSKDYRYRVGNVDMELPNLKDLCVWKSMDQHLNDGEKQLLDFLYEKIEIFNPDLNKEIKEEVGEKWGTKFFGNSVLEEMQEDSIKEVDGSKKMINEEMTQ